MGENMTWDFTVGNYIATQDLTIQYLDPPFDGLPGANRPEFADAQTFPKFVVGKNRL